MPLGLTRVKHKRTEVLKCYGWSIYLHHFIMEALFEGAARDVEELKKAKGYDNTPPYGYYDMPTQSSYQFHDGGYQRRCPPKVKTMKGNKNRAKTTKTESSAKIQQPISQGRGIGNRNLLQTVGLALPSAVGYGRHQYTQLDRTLIQDFNLQLGDSKDELGRSLSFENYERNTDDIMEARWASMLEQRVENIVFQS
ncbi:hypothetical protein M9H77_12746 [Catharanthus roseus]|uniref:Uncharacterized protein n=1 Tax=Catharanthus roseus TaxID=4058 RepID=A0ACC0BIA4_CATRO|nr:hypothetical protein M9H77_12746 [Catharanthus roseus]